MKKLIIPKRPNIVGFTVSEDGRVFKPNGELVEPHLIKGQYVVRLCNNCDSISITLSKCILLAYDFDGYSEGLIAIHMNGKLKDNSRSNLRWGTRGEQAKLSNDRDPIRFKELHKSSPCFKMDRGSKVRELISQGLGYKDMKVHGISTATYYKYR